MRKIFTEMSSWSQLFFLWLFFVVGYILAGVILLLTLPFFTNEPVPDVFSLSLESPVFTRVMQIIQQICLFFIPASLCIYLFSKKPVSYLGLDKKVSFQYLLASVFVIFTVQPLVSFTSYYNQMLKLPGFMSGIEKWMKALEENAAVLMERILAVDTFEMLLINLFVVAIVAAITEELFFRGALQQIFSKIFNNYHISVWITAFIFSAVHMQFYGFIPRLILGVLLGYLFVFTRSLWMPVLVHFINNAMGVILFYKYNGTPEYDAIENMGARDMWWTALTGTLLTLVILYYLGNDYSKKTKQAHF